jgi:thymidylate synthase (FAD)
MSARYTKMPDLHYVPSQDRVKKQSKTNKQGSGETVGGQDAEYFRNQIAKQQEGIYSYYEDFCKNGIALELARINTPVSRYTRMRCTANLRNWFGFLSLRASPAAQWEIQRYAEAVSEIVKAMFPRSYALWEEGQASETFSKAEVRTLLDNIAEPDHLPEKLRKKLGL